MRRVWNILASMRTALALMAAIAALFLYGSVHMTTSPAYENLKSGGMFTWMVHQPVSVTFWLWGSVGLAALLAVSTVACSIESFKKKQGLLLLLAPQVIHLGFLLIVFAHLLGAIWGFDMQGYLPAGQVAAADLNGQPIAFKLTGFKAEGSQGGATIGWKAWISFLKDGQPVKEDYMAPNRPVFFGGYGFYLKDIDFEPGPVALIEISREPGAFWALAGGILFVAGSVLLLILRIRQE